jgi:hypothetical protein
MAAASVGDLGFVCGAAGVVSVTPDTPALDAMVLMEERGISAVAVVGGGGGIVGNFSISELRCASRVCRICAAFVIFFCFDSADVRWRARGDSPRALPSLAPAAPPRPAPPRPAPPRPALAPPHPPPHPRPPPHPPPASAAPSWQSTLALWRCPWASSWR